MGGGAECWPGGGAGQDAGQVGGGAGGGRGRLHVYGAIEGSISPLVYCPSPGECCTADDVSYCLVCIPVHFNSP